MGICATPTYTAVKSKKSDKTFVYLIITGVLAGLTVGIKYTGGIVFLPILIIILLDQSVSILKRVQQLLISLFIAGSIFLLACPFILISFDRFLPSLSRLNEFKHGFYGLFPKYAENGYQWYLTIGFPWGYGIVFSVLAVLAILFGIFYSVKKRDFIILSFPITIFGYLIIVCQYHMYMMRYILLITPLICILLAICIVENFNFLVKIINKPLLSYSQHIFLFLIVVVILIQPFFFMMAYNTLFSKENVRIEAQHWIESQLDQNETINLGPSPSPPSWMLPPLEPSSYVSQPLFPSNGSNYYLVCEPLAHHIYLRYFHEKYLYLDKDFTPQKPPSDEILKYYSALTYDNTNYELIAVFNRSPKFLWFTIDESNAPYEVTHVTHPELRIYKKRDNTQISNEIIRSS